jgi:hypothetical protein
VILVLDPLIDHIKVLPLRVWGCYNHHSGVEMCYPRFQFVFLTHITSFGTCINIQEIALNLHQFRKFLLGRKYIEILQLNFQQTCYSLPNFCTNNRSIYLHFKSLVNCKYHNPTIDASSRGQGLTQHRKKPGWVFLLKIPMIPSGYHKF